MTTYLPKELAEGLQEARRREQRRTTRFRVEVDGQRYRVLRLWETGFAVDAETVPPLRGLVELFEGPNCIASCLIMAAAEDHGEMQYEYKRSTQARTEAPRDFGIEDDAPVALIGRA